MSASSNFTFLEEHEPELYELASVAEDLVHRSPTTALRELRTFGEVLLRRVVEETSISISGSTQHDRLVEMETRGQLPRQILEALHQIRMRGNDASHENTGTQARARQQLRNAWTAAVWFHEKFHSSEAIPAQFELPDETESDAEVRSEIEALRTRLESVEGRQQSEEMKRLKARIAELESDQSASSSHSPTGQRSGPSLRDKVQRAGRALWNGISGVGNTLADWVRVIASQLRRLGTTVVRGVRRTIRVAVYVALFGGLLLYFPTIYATGIDLIPQDVRTSVPEADTVRQYHAKVIPRKAKLQVEAAASKGMAIVQRKGVAITRRVKKTAVKFWTEDRRRPVNRQTDDQ